jgi:succinate-semialdehyde dehydrogenase / glutarate-semialdehyde dehydrogenase
MTAGTGSVPITKDRALETVRKDLFIAGQWRAASGGARIAVKDPATGLVLAEVADATPADAVDALAAAHAAHPGWATAAPRERAELLRRAFELVIEHGEELALLMTLEMGKPLPQARAELTYGAEYLRYYAEEAIRIGGRHSTTADGAGSSLVTRHPVGPCLLITPWNFPLAMATRKIAPALAAGCTVVLKPSELTPLTSLALAGLIEQAGVPSGVLNIVTTSAAGAAMEPLLRDPRLRKISFTGSTSVGVHLLEQAAGRVLRTSMELGGNAPFLVFDDAELDHAVEAVMEAKFRNAGQACTAANRVLVHAPIAEEFSRRLAARTAALTVGRGIDPGIDVGPLIDERAVAKAQRLVDDAVRCGARVLTGGTPIDGAGCFFAPTVLDRVPAEAAISREEVFAPVLPIRTFEDEEDAIRLANDTDFGLVAYVCGGDSARSARVAERLEVGMVGIDVGVVSDVSAPFGGWKLSGLGREGGPEGLQDYLQTKYTLTHVGKRDHAAVRPAIGAIGRKAGSS